MYYYTYLFHTAQILRSEITSLPYNVLDWFEGSDAALLCTVETNGATSNMNAQWSNTQGIFNGTIVVSISDTVYLSILEFRSLHVHSDIYYCRASLGGSVKQDWHYVNVDSGMS